MVLNTLTVMITVVVLRLYHADPRVPPPAWLRVVVHKGLARMVCKRFPTNIAIGSGEHSAFTVTVGNAVAGYDVRDTVSSQAGDSVATEGSLPGAHYFTNKEGIEIEYRFMAVIIDTFFARCFLLIFMGVVVLLFWVCPLLMKPYVENSE